MVPKNIKSSFIGTWIFCGTFLFYGLVSLFSVPYSSGMASWILMAVCCVAVGAYGFHSARTYRKFYRRTINVDGEMLIVLDEKGGVVSRALISDYRAFYNILGFRQKFPHSNTHLRLDKETVVLVGLLSLEDQEKLIAAWPVKPKITSARLAQAWIHMVAYGFLVVFLATGIRLMLGKGDLIMATCLAFGVLIALFGLWRVTLYSVIAGNAFTIDGRSLRVLFANKKAISINLDTASRFHYDFNNQICAQPQGQYGITVLVDAPVRVKVPSGLLLQLEGESAMSGEGIVR